MHEGTDMPEDLLHDESLHPSPGRPLCIVEPHSTEEVSAIAAACSRVGRPMVARGSGTGLSGAAVASDGCGTSFCA